MAANILPEEGIMPNFREGFFFTIVIFKALEEGENKNNK
jgi:hypothetical protein